MKREAVIGGIIIAMIGLIASFAYTANREILIPEPTTVTSTSHSVVYPTTTVTNITSSIMYPTTTVTEIQTITSTSTKTLTQTRTDTLDTGDRIVEGGSRYITKIDVPVASTLSVEFRAPDGYRFNVFLWDSTQYQLFINQAPNVPSVAQATEQASGTITVSVQPGTYYVNFKNNDGGLLGLLPKSHQITWTIRQSYPTQIQEPVTLVQTQTVQRVTTLTSTVSRTVSSIVTRTSTVTSTISSIVTTTRTSSEIYLPYQLPGYGLIALGVLTVIAGVILQARKIPSTEKKN